MLGREERGVDINTCLPSTGGGLLSFEGDISGRPRARSPPIANQSDKRRKAEQEPGAFPFGHSRDQLMCNPPEALISIIRAGLVGASVVPLFHVRT